MKTNYLYPKSIYGDADHASQASGPHDLWETRDKSYGKTEITTRKGHSPT